MQMRSLTSIAVLAGTLFASNLSAQEIVTTPIQDVPLNELIGQLIVTPNEPEGNDYLSTSTEAVVQQVTSGTAGELRVLDKLTGAVTDLSLALGETGQLGFLTVRLNDCRYPVENPSGDAFAQLIVSDSQKSATLFSGWMMASAPALNAMDHPRYDVWALRCITPEAD